MRYSGGRSGHLLAKLCQLSVCATSAFVACFFFLLVAFPSLITLPDQAFSPTSDMHSKINWHYHGVSCSLYTIIYFSVASTLQMAANIRDTEFDPQRQLCCLCDLVQMQHHTDVCGRLR
jgi:hypothetical protein